MKVIFKNVYFWFFLSLLLLVLAVISFFPGIWDVAISYDRDSQIATIPTKEEKPKIPVIPPLDKVAYDLKLNQIANNPPPKIIVPKKDKDGNEIPPPPPKPTPWPVKTVYPEGGAILPFSRIIAYYGNFFSKQMGVLGQYPEDKVIEMLKAEVAKWEAADPSTPVVPAIHYIAVVAQASAGADGKYRFRMPAAQIDKAIAMAAKVNGIVFLDLQVGLSTVEKEIPPLENYLKLPQVHLAIDPEFSIKTNSRPGKVIGTLDAADINFAAEYLAKLAKDNNLPPKILIIHRFTQAMVTNYKAIKPLPGVEIIINMDGWGVQAKKINTYQQFIYAEPVQFTGFKLFYHNDTLTPGSVLMPPEKLLKLNPQPIYIQYQ